MTGGSLVSIGQTETNYTKWPLTFPPLLTSINTKNFATCSNKFWGIAKISTLHPTSNSMKKIQQNWDLLKEAIKNPSNRNKIESTTVNNSQTTDVQTIGNEFNSFLPNIGTTISPSINMTQQEPDEFIPPWLQPAFLSALCMRIDLLLVFLCRPVLETFLMCCMQMLACSQVSPAASIIVCLSLASHGSSVPSSASSMSTGCTLSSLSSSLLLWVAL